MNDSSHSICGYTPGSIFGVSEPSEQFLDGDLVSSPYVRKYAIGRGVFLETFYGRIKSAAVPSLFQTNCRQISLSRGESNPQPDFVEIPSSGLAERYNVRSFCRSRGRKRARNLKMFGGSVQVDDVRLEDVDLGVEIPSSGLGERYNVRSFCRSRGRKRTRNTKAFADSVEVDDVRLEDVDRGGLTDMYIDIADCHWICEHCHATFWYGERIKNDSNHDRPKYHRCCAGGKVVSQWPRAPPDEIKKLFGDKGFQENIRAYNQMFSMTSFKAHIDDSVNKRRGPYVLKISGQIYHWIGSLCPTPGNPPRFLQLYIYDTENEVANRMRYFPKGGSSQLDPEIVSSLIRVLDAHNELLRLFRTTRDRISANVIPNFGYVFFMLLEYANMICQLQHRGTDKRMSMNLYYMFQLHERLDSYGLLFWGGRLFQQYVVGVYCSIEQNLLDFYRLRQNDIGREYLSGVYDAICRGDREGSEIGARVILPRTFTGGPRYMYSHYLDALAICRALGNPHYFITFTCNVKWPEIKRHMQQFLGLTPADRADIVARVFEQKVQDFCRFLKERQPFGSVAGLLYTIEFQKHGLPHCHTLLWVEPKDKIQHAVDVDQYISAELPDPESDPQGYGVISEMMVHGPCGPFDSEAICMKEGKCGKKSPKKYNDSTFFDADGYVHYRRRQTNTYTTRWGVDLDNSCIVPYNRALCLTFHAHINVEYCRWSMLIKYLFKYILKGTDKIAAKIVRPVGEPPAETDAASIKRDEIQNFIDGRFICPHEACWRILKYEIHGRQPAVQILSVHLENMQSVTFRDRQPLTLIVNDEGKINTTLIGWLEYKKFNQDGRHLAYIDFPKEFVWYSDSKSWRRRKKKTTCSIGRLANVHPTSGELFYLRMLLCHQTGCRSFEDIRTESLRSEDLYMNDPELEGGVLCELEVILNTFSKTVSDYGLPPLSKKHRDILRNRELMEEKSYNRVELAKEQQMIFVYRHGGTGKTFLWKTLIDSMRSEGKIVLAVASSGIASLLLLAGRTAHSRFKLPLELTAESLCNIKKNKHASSLLAETNLIIWDESPVNDKRCFEVLDRTLRDILDAPDTLFGGKTIVLGGDFRQTLPVKKGASKSEIVGASIAESELWPRFKICRLKQNTRLLQPGLTKDERRRAADFATCLLDIGDGKVGKVEDNSEGDSSWVTIPEEYCLPDNDNGLRNLIGFIYDEQTLQQPTVDDLH
nr:DNA helicase [Tanacetum cinerariifolium]